MDVCIKRSANEITYNQSWQSLTSHLLIKCIQNAMVVAWRDMAWRGVAYRVDVTDETRWFHITCELVYDCKTASDPENNNDNNRMQCWTGKDFCESRANCYCCCCCCCHSHSHIVCYYHALFSFLSLCIRRLPYFIILLHMLNTLYGLHFFGSEICRWWWYQSKCECIQKYQDRAASMWYVRRSGRACIHVATTFIQLCSLNELKWVLSTSTQMMLFIFVSN